MIAALFADEGLAPTAARTPWTVDGAGSTTIVDWAFKVQGAAAFSIKVDAADSDARPTRRNGELLQIQAEVQGLNEAGAWPSGASAIMLGLDDGHRALAVSIGSTLRLVSLDAGLAIFEVATNHPWTQRTAYRLAKHRSERWDLFVSGKLVASIPYDFAPASTAAARCWWGSWANGNTALFGNIEASTRPLADAWRLEQAFYNLPSPIRNRWTSVGRAILRASVNLFEGAIQALMNAYGAAQAGRGVFARSEVPAGSIWPVAWSTAGAWTLVRGRIRAPESNAGATAERFFDLSLAPDHVEHRLAATWLLWSYTADSYGRLGPVMAIDTGARLVVAQLFEADGAAGWAFTTGVSMGGAVEPLGRRWPVNPFRAHRVELVTQKDIALLLVDGAIIDRAPLDIFDASASLSAIAQIATCAGALPVVDLEGVVAEQASADERRRQARLDLAAEGLIFLGGRERNEEIEALAHHSAGVMAARGTSAGIVAELRHLCGRGDGAWLTEHREPLEWVLDRSYPEHTPVYIDRPGYDGVRVYAHWEHAAPNFTVDSLGALVLRHLLPVSTSEISYYAAVATRLTGDAVRVSALYVRLPVWSSAAFGVGDACIIRDEAGAVYEEVTINEVISAVAVRVIGLTDPTDFPAGAVLMRVLGRS